MLLPTCPLRSRCWICPFPYPMPTCIIISSGSHTQCFPLWNCLQEAIFISGLEFHRLMMHQGWATAAKVPKAPTLFQSLQCLSVGKVSQPPFPLIIFLSFTLIYSRLSHDQKHGDLVPGMVPLKDRGAVKRSGLVRAIKFLRVCPEENQKTPLSFCPVLATNFVLWLNVTIIWPAAPKLLWVCVCFSSNTLVIKWCR